DNVMRSNARSLSLVANAGADADWADPSLWPDEGTFGLSGGTDGLEGISVTDYLRLLEQIARVEEAALISAPDLVLQDPAQPEADDLPPEPVDCCDLSPAAPGRVRARVVEVDVDGLEQPLNRVEVDVAGPGGRTVTNSDGVFTASNVALGLVTVRLAKAGFEPSEVLVQATTFLPSEPVTLTMTRVNLPRALVEDEIIEVVQALANPARVGSYKVVIVDPPSPDAVLDDLRTWRARLGDSQRMGFFAPWLTLPDDEADGGLIPCPPSGHVCGAFAAGEIAEGIHRTGANLPLRFVQGTTLEINDVEQSILNPAGINAIRTLPGRGVRAFGTRTLSSDTDWRYLTARRIVDAVEKTLERTLQWMVFEPNSLMTRHAVQQSAASLLSRLQRRGILSGDTPEQAFRVKCDLENNPDESRAAGQLVCDIGIAPTTPFEFVLFRLGSAFEALKVTETSQ
ncbi:MAG: phage tail sheath C-terminal domain-containing protein, partial [Pseudomonadota bacterium]